MVRPNDASHPVSGDVPDRGGGFGNPFSSSDSPGLVFLDQQHPMLENSDREAGLELPYDFSYTASRIWRVMRLQCIYPEVQARKLALFSGDRQCSICTRLLAGLAVVLSSYTGQDKLCIGSTHLRIDGDEAQTSASAGADLRILRLDL